MLLCDGALCTWVDLRAAPKQEIKAALRSAFGPVELIKHEHRYLMAEQ